MTHPDDTGPVYESTTVIDHTLIHTDPDEFADTVRRVVAAATQSLTDDMRDAGLTGAGVAQVAVVVTMEEPPPLPKSLTGVAYDLGIDVAGEAAPRNRRDAFEHDLGDTAQEVTKMDPLDTTPADR